MILPEVQAQQAATPPSTAAPAMPIAELKSRRIAIESMTDIDSTLKTESLNYIDLAITYIELAFSTGKKTNEISLLMQTAPERLKILQAELKKPFTAPEKVAARAEHRYQMGQFTVAGCGFECRPWIRVAGDCGKP